MTSANPSEPTHLEWLEIELNEKLTGQECLDVYNSLSSMQGVVLARFAPEGCFGQDQHRLNVLFNTTAGDKSKVEKIPGIEKVIATPAGPG